MLTKNTKGDRKNYIPEKLKEQTPLLLEHEDKSIEIAPDLDGETSAFTESGTFQKADGITEKVEDLYENEREETTGVSYLTKDEAMELQYISCKDGVKENIILNENPESPVFRYHVDLKGLTPQVNTRTGNIDLYEEDAKEPSAYIQAPYMEDASGENYSEDASYGLEKEEDGSWTLTLTVDADYLAYAQYPVTIDPTTTWRSNPSLRDAYVIKGSKYGSTNFYDSGITAMSVGKATQGYSRTFLKVDDLAKTIKGYNVVSAAFYFYENGSNATSNTVQVRPVSEDWAIKSVSWNNQPAYGGAVGSAKTNGVSGHELKMDVTGWCRKIATGASINNGVVLRNEDEGSQKYTKLYGTRHATTAKTPKLVIKYVDGPTTAASVSVSPTYIKKGQDIKLTWSGIKSSYLSYIQYRVANSKGENVVNYSVDTKIGSVSSGSKTVTTGSWADGTYRYYIRGVDTGGIKGTGKGVNVVVDNTAPVLNSVTSSAGTKKIKPSDVKISWKGTETNLASVQYKVGDGSYRTATKALSGNVMISKSTFTKSGDYTVSVKMADKVGLSATKSVVIHIDKDAPVMQSVTTTPQAVTENVPSKVTNPIINWTVKNCADLERVEYSLNGKDYKTMGKTLTGSFTLPEKSFLVSGKHLVYVRAVDQTGNIGPALQAVYWLDDIELDMNDYAVTDISANESYGKALLSWQTKNPLPEKMDVRIYRSKTKGFTPSKENVVYEGSGTSYWADMENLEGTYYYRISVLRKNAKGSVIEEKLNNQEVSVKRVKIQASVESRTGNMYWGSYFSYALPAGNGSVEKSSGNNLYTQQDFSLSNNCLNYGLTRFYNSGLKDLTGIFGKGWTDSWRMELYYSGADILLLSNDGSVYTFPKSDVEKESICNENASYTLQSENEGYKLQLSGSEEYDFNKYGQLTGWKEANGNQLENVYDDHGVLIQIVSHFEQESEKTLNLNYAENGRLSEITLPDNTIMDYHYEDDNLTVATHKDADEIASVSYLYQYDDQNQMVEILDAKKQGYKINYQGSKVSQFGYPDGEKVQFSYKEGQTVVSKYGKSNEQISTESVLYDPENGKILKSVDASGDEVSYKYEYADNLLLSTGTESVVYYQEIENGKFVQKEKAQTTKTTYNEDEKVVKEVSNLGGTETYEYDESGNVVSEKSISSLGEIVANERYEYDEEDNLINEEDLVNNVENIYTYTEEGNLLTEKEIQEEDLESYEAAYQYDEDGNKTEAEITEGNIQSQETMEYDPMGRMVKNVSEDGSIVAYTYDFLGRCIETKTTSKEDESVEIQQQTFDPNGAVVAEVTEDGTVYEYAYDSRNRQTKKIQKRTSDITYTTVYETAQDLTIQNGVQGYNCPFAYVQIDYRNGRETGRTYTDKSGNVVRTVQNGIYTDKTYDNNGQEIISVSYTKEQQGVLTLTAYDDNGNVSATVINPEISGQDYMVGKDSVYTKQNYDENGNLTRSTDALGVTTAYAYDGEQRLVGITEDSEGDEPIHSSLAYQTSEEGSTTIRTDANGSQQIEKTDAAGLLLFTEDTGADGKKLFSNYTYDSSGQLKKQTYADGSHADYEYDGKHQLIRQSFYTKEGTLEEETLYQYDARGNITEEIDYKINADQGMEPYLYRYYRYDAYQRLTGYAELQQTAVPDTEAIESAMSVYTYDDEDRLLKQSYPSGAEEGIQALSYHYDETDFSLKSIGLLSGDQEKTLRSYSYDSFGRMTNIRTNVCTESNSGYMEMIPEYDTLERISGIRYLNQDGEEKESHRYVYDKKNQIVSETDKNTYGADEKIQINRKRTFQYDNVGRLVKNVEEDQHSSEKKTTTYTYDKVGNRLSMDKDGEVTSYQYNGLNQLVSRKTTAGDKITADVSYEYDLRGNQIKESDSVNGQTSTSVYTVSGTLEEYTISKNDQQILKQTNLYDGSGERICKTENGTVTKYIHDRSGLLYSADENGDNQTFYLSNESGNKIAMSHQGKMYFYTQDIRFSTMSLLDEDMQLASLYDYDIFGETTVVKDAKNANEICYTGSVWDAATGLYYLSSRYMDPENGRFLSQDTYRGEADDTGSWNFYGYCEGNPVTYTDCSGYFIETALDLASVSYSAAEFIKDRSWINLGYLAWDVASVFVPCVPGSYTVKAVKVTKVLRKTKKGSKTIRATAYVNRKYIRFASKASEFMDAKYLNIGKYTKVKYFVDKCKPCSKVEVHHIIEGRFLQIKNIKVPGKKLKQQVSNMLCVPIDKELHREITIRWRNAIPYKSDYEKLTKQDMIVAINTVYKDMYALKRYARRYLDKIWK